MTQIALGSPVSIEVYHTSSYSLLRGEVYTCVLEHAVVRQNAHLILSLDRVHSTIFCSH